MTDPAGTVVSFIQEYERTYGDQHPHFYPGTYSQVLNEAKKELKFLLVYLHCKDHQHTDRFCRQTLSDPRVIQYVNENCIMWACSVDTTEGYRVSQSLRENTYPFLAIIVQRDFKMTVVGRYLIINFYYISNYSNFIFKSTELKGLWSRKLWSAASV